MRWRTVRPILDHGRMPKKKHRRGSQRPASRKAPSPGEQHRRRERDLQALLAQFALWRRESVSQEQADDEAAHVEPLLRLKDEQLESPDPTYWTEQLIEVLLTQVVPRKVVQPREMAMEQGPALGQFFAFLESRGRWHRDGLEVGQARRVLEGLEFTVLEAADDPSARSFSGNLMTYASTLGVGLEAPEQFDDFVQWYNTALTDAERHEISDTGRLASPSTTFDPAEWSGAAAPVPSGGSAFFPDAAGQGASSAADGFADAPPWPWFLPDRSEMEQPLLALAQAEEDPRAIAAEHAEVALVQRAAQLLEFVGDGRPATATGALKLVDVRHLIEEWGLDLAPERLTSMWQVDEITGPWVALLTGGWITTTGTKVRPGDEALAPYSPASEDAESFTRFARAAMLMLLISISQEDPEENGLRGGQDTMAALLFAAGPDGLALPEPFSDLSEVLSPSPASGSLPALEKARRLWRVQGDLVRLAGYGLLWCEREASDGSRRFHGNHATLAALITAGDVLRDDPR